MGGHVPPPQVLGYQLTLIGPRGADYAHHITTSFRTMRHLCYMSLNPTPTNALSDPWPHLNLCYVIYVTQSF